MPLWCGVLGAARDLTSAWLPRSSRLGEEPISSCFPLPAGTVTMKVKEVERGEAWLLGPLGPVALGKPPQPPDLSCVRCLGDRMRWSPRPLGQKGWAFAAAAGPGLELLSDGSCQLQIQVCALLLPQLPSPRPLQPALGERRRASAPATRALPRGSRAQRPRHRAEHLPAPLVKHPRRGLALLPQRLRGPGRWSRASTGLNAAPGPRGPEPHTGSQRAPRRDL